jgi:hypothetical protein
VEHEAGKAKTGRGRGWMQIVDDAGKVLLGFLGLLSVHDGKVLHELAECAR